MKEELINEIVKDDEKVNAEPKIVLFKKGSVKAWRYEKDEKELKKDGWVKA